MNKSARSRHSRHGRPDGHVSSSSATPPPKNTCRWKILLGIVSLLLFPLVILVAINSGEKTGWEEKTIDEKYDIRTEEPVRGAPTQPAPPPELSKVERDPAPRSTGSNLIFMIGDGMGFQHVAAARFRQGKLAMDQCPVTGRVSTASINGEITDSAASATAFSTGQKTANERVSKTPEGDDLITLGEYAKRKGMRTGIVVTSSVTDATPAGFFSHVSNRKQKAEIAKQLTDFGVDVMIGGGWGWFLPQNEKTSLRTDNLNLITTFNQAFGRDIFFRIEKTLKRKPTGNGVIALFSANDPPPVGGRSFTLGNLTKVALDELPASHKNFFLLVEGSQIDWASHRNDFTRIVDETLDFDTAVKTVLDFARKDGNTLVVITADHETGGLKLTQNEFTGKLEASFSSKNHTAAIVPLFAYGPGSEAFGGVKDNAEIGAALIRFLHSQHESLKK